jgi:tetratricopeptide (TPR) repeat protein
MKQSESKDEKFLTWLSPSYWLVEAQLHSFREQRGENTLTWAPDLKEFQSWRLSDYGSDDRILWIRGTLGIGKSTLAGYYVDLLKCHYPNSVVAYFFCRSNQAGLTKARDIIRTLAYQCVLGDCQPRSVLEALRTQGFRISDDLGVSFLFEKLLRDPLRLTKKEIFIIVDGLDEADLTTLDETDRSERPEMRILLHCLTKLSSTRLLFLSRPAANISSTISTIVRPIGMAENGQDINAYVEKTIAKSDKLKMFFANEKIDPITYFGQYANGIFLWVVLVLQQLDNAKSKFAFQKLLNGFSAASGSMDKLYLNILSKFTEDDGVWLREITRWIVVARRQFFESDLQKAVEWRLGGDSLADFRGFLEVECGSVLHMPPMADNSDRPVQLVHETFRSFLLNPAKCLPGFLIREDLAHGEVVLSCLNDLAEHGEASFSAKTYGLREWVYHLSLATSAEQAPNLLNCLLKFLDSDELGLWIRRSLISEYGHQENLLTLENSSIAAMITWIRQNWSDAEKQSVNFGEWGVETTTVQRFLKDPSACVGECIGKGATRLWANGELLCYEAHESFRWALKYYLQHEATANTREEFAVLIANEFEPLIAWAGQSDIKPARRNFGMAYYFLERWDKCIECLEEGIACHDDAPRYLGMAYLASSDFDSAIKTFWRAIETGNSDELWFRPGLLLAYEGRGKFDEAIKELKCYIDLNPSNAPAKVCIGYLCCAKEEYDAAITWFDQTDERDSWTFHGLYTAYRLKRDYARAVERFSNLRDSMPRSWYWETQLIADCYYDVGDWEGEIRLITEELNLRSNDLIGNRLLERYAHKEDWDAIISFFQRAINDYSGGFFAEPVVKAYMTTHNIDEAINVFKKLEAKDPVLSLWGQLNTYTLSRDYDSVIKVFNENSVYHYLGKEKFGYDSIIKAIEAYASKGDVDGAFDLIVRQRPMDLECLLALKVYDDAISLLEREVREHPLSPELWHALGISYMESGKYEEAAGVFRTASELIRVDYSFFLRLGNALCSYAQYNDAIDAYNTAIKRAWNNSSISLALIDHRVVGYCHETYCRPVQSKQISIDESLSKRFLWFWLGRAHSAVKNDAEAERIYSAAIDGYRIALAKRSRNKLFWKYCRDRLYGSIDVFAYRQSLPKRILWCALGMAYECRRDIKYAFIAYQKCLAFEPDNVWLQTVLAKLREDVSQVVDEGGDAQSSVGDDIREIDPESRDIEEMPVYRLFKPPRSHVWNLYNLTNFKLLHY